MRKGSERELAHRGGVSYSTHWFEHYFTRTLARKGSSAMTKAVLRIVVVGSVVCLLAAGCATNGETETAEPMMETEVVSERVPEVVPEKAPEAVPEAVPEEVPDAGPRVLDDFEEEILWKSAAWKNSNPVEVSPV
jgi:hypothetical protein